MSQDDRKYTKYPVDKFPLEIRVYVSIHKQSKVDISHRKRFLVALDALTTESGLYLLCDLHRYFQEFSWLDRSFRHHLTR